MDTPAWIEALTQDEIDVIYDAYLILSRAGNETATGETWEPLIDATHQSLGVMVALIASHRPGTLRSARMYGYQRGNVLRRLRYRLRRILFP
jgi:hypothetical protein